MVQKKLHITEKRVNGNGRRGTDQYCPMHESLVNSNKNILAGFKWLVALHIGEYLMIIGGLGAFIMFLLQGKVNVP